MWQQQWHPLQTSCTEVSAKFGWVAMSWDEMVGLEAWHDAC